MNPYTLEKLIEGLDSRGMLVLQVLLGQHAMNLLAKDKVKEVTGTSGKILLPTEPIKPVETL